VPERASCRVVALMGSGETSPTMVGVHRDLVARLGEPVAAVVLDTPYGFQENAAEVSARARRYFAESVGMAVTVPPGLDKSCEGLPVEEGLAAVRAADWLFAGPGSPSYALAHWRGTPLADALRDRVEAGAGITVFASAAACTAGRFTLPVYEIYKAGAPPHWLDGLDLTGSLGLDVAVIPHYDNAEGGTHDTRYCYLGERRLRVMEAALPEECAVLGIDEHTAVVLDVSTGVAEVRGRGALTVRRHGRSTVVPAGEVLTLDELRALARGAGNRDRAAPDPGVPRPSRPAEVGAASLRETVLACEQRFEAALAARDATGLLQAVLDIDTAITAWAADTEEEDDPESARAVQRSLIVRLGDVAARGLHDPREALAPAVEPLLDVRADLRRQGSWMLADAVRTGLRAAGVEIQDTDEGTRWLLHDPPGGTDGVSR
jgi:hypothetical protein